MSKENEQVFRCMIEEGFNKGNLIEPLMVYIPAGSFLMGTSDQQVEWLARNDDLAEKWRSRGVISSSASSVI